MAVLGTIEHLESSLFAEGLARVIGGVPANSGRRLVEIRQELAEDWWEVEALYDLCFAPGREALSSYRLRDGVDPVGDLCLVAQDEDGTVGAAVRFWPVRVGGAPALLLGPLATHPTRQGEGLAAVLIREGLQRARLEGWKRVLLIGDAPYYGKFGFQSLSDVVMPPPTNPDRVLGLSLKAGAWDGVLGEVTKFL
jgi:predicted N-acetyltransferase YhbS